MILRTLRRDKSHTTEGAYSLAINLTSFYRHKTATTRRSWATIYRAYLKLPFAAAMPCFIGRKTARISKV